MATQNNKNTKYSNRKSIISEKKKVESGETKTQILNQFSNFLNLIKIKHLS